MTICIVAEYGTREDRGLILCSDWKASTALGSSETSYKQHFLPHNWYALGAGSESDILSFVALLKLEFDAVKEINETNVQSLIRGAIQKRKNQKADEYISSKFGVSYKDFIDIGKTKFPEELFRAAFTEVSRIDLGADLIVAGFNNLQLPLICEATNDGVHIRDNFATIGEGAYLATSVFRHRQYHGVEDLNRAIYVVYEAKRYAERVGSVGTQTLLRVLRENDTHPINVNGEGIEFLASQFTEYGPQPIYDIPFEDKFLGNGQILIAKRNTASA